MATRESKMEQFEGVSVLDSLDSYNKQYVNSIHLFLWGLKAKVLVSAWSGSG